MKWIKIDDKLPPEGETVIFAGFLKYDHEEEGEYITDVGSFDYEGMDAHDGKLWNTWNDWYEGQQTYRIDYWKPLPRHPEENI